MDTSKADAMLGIVDAEVEELAMPEVTDITVIEAKETLPAVPTHTLAQVDDTINFAKDNIKDAIETMKDVITDAALVARNTGIADQYSSVSSLVGTMVAANKALVDIESKQHKMHKDEAQGDGPSSSQPNVTNNLNFHGTTQELAAFLKDIRNKNGEPKLLQEG